MNDVRLPPPVKVRRTRQPRTTPGRNGVQGLVVWHRRLGIATAAIVLLLAITGLLLNHSHRLGLDTAQIEANWLLRWYGFPPTPSLTSYRVGERWVSWSGSRLFLDGSPIMEGDKSPVGASALTNGSFAVGFPDALVLLSGSGELVERIGSASLPGTVVRVGAAQGPGVVIETTQGIFSSDENLLAWQPGSSKPVWSRSEPAPTETRVAVSKAERGPGLSAERVLQDLHSGRLFGSWGPWFMDAAALAFIVLAATGLYYWWTRRATFTRPSPGRRKQDR
jgi:hypothetical protein